MVAGAFIEYLADMRGQRDRLQQKLGKQNLAFLGAAFGKNAACNRQHDVAGLHFGKAQVLQHLEFLRLGERRVLLITVAPDGDVQNRVLLTAKDYSQSELVEASHFINHHYSGMALGDLRQRLEREAAQLQGEIAALMQAALQPGQASPAHEEQVVLAGERKLLGVSDFSSNISQLRRAYELFEHKAELMQLLESSAHGQGVRIFIGGESQTLPVEELSIVSAPYAVNGDIVGSLGVIGPTRMPYKRMVQIVDITAKLVSNALSYPQT